MDVRNPQIGLFDFKNITYVNRNNENKGISRASVNTKLEKFIKRPEPKQRRPDNHAVYCEENSILHMSQTEINVISIRVVCIKNNKSRLLIEQDLYNS